MELFAKIFVAALILGMLIMTFYCIYHTNRIRAKWKKNGVDECELRAEFYGILNRDDE